MTPVLYLIMRNDIPSMNPGKLAAQAAHVANQFVFDWHREYDSMPAHIMRDMFKQWVDNRGFGTSITLGAPKFWYQTGAFNIPYTLYDDVSDPTYPCSIPYEAAQWIKDYTVWHNRYNDQQQLNDHIILGENGNATLLRDELVGAYYFADKDNDNHMAAINDLKLFP